MLNWQTVQSLLGVWFELSPLSVGLRAGKEKAADTPALEKCGAARYYRCFSLCTFKVAKWEIKWMIHAFLSPINKSRHTFKLITGLLPSIEQWDYILIQVENDFTASRILIPIHLWGKTIENNPKVVAKALLYSQLSWKYLQNAASSNSRNPVNTVVTLPNNKRPFGPLQVCARERVSEVLKFFYVSKCTLSTLLSWITCYFWVIYVHVSQQLRLLWTVCTNYEFLFSFYFISEACLNSSPLEDSTLRLFLLFAASAQQNILGPSIICNYA